jgi:translation elongation factor EF-Tu-like GTPase
MRLVLFAGTLAVIGCAGGSSMPKPASPLPSFTFTVQEVFYIKPPVDRVILVGIVNEGTVRVGDQLTVSCRDGDVKVQLEVIETIDRGPVQEARAGQQVGLRLVGIRKDQPARGDRVVRQRPQLPAADRSGN